MKQQHENLLITSLAGLVIISAAAFVVTPAHAAGYEIDQKAQVVGVEYWDQLNVRKWPASYSRKTGALSPQSWVWVERCIEVADSTDWCKISVGEQQGWVNSNYLSIDEEYAD